MTPPSPILDRVRNGPPSSGGGLARLFRLRLGAKLELSFLLIIIVISLILSLVGTWVIGGRFEEQAQEKVAQRPQLGAGDLPEQPGADQRRGPFRLGPGLRPLAGDGRRPGPAAAPAVGHRPAGASRRPDADRRPRRRGPADLEPRRVRRRPERAAARARRARAARAGRSDGGDPARGVGHDLARARRAGDDRAGPDRQGAVARRAPFHGRHGAQGGGAGVRLRSPLHRRRLRRACC